MSELTSSKEISDPAPKSVAGESGEHFLNFAFPGEKVTPGCVNGRKFEFPGVTSLYQDDMMGKYDCDKYECGPDKVCLIGSSMMF